MRSRGTRRWGPTPAVQTLRKPRSPQPAPAPRPAAAGLLHLASVPRFLRRCSNACRVWRVAHLSPFRRQTVVFSLFLLLTFMT